MNISKQSLQSKLTLKVMATRMSWVGGWCMTWVVGFTVSPANAQQTFFDQQWGFKNVGQVACDMFRTDCKRGVPGADIKAPMAWTKVNDCSSVIVAILDTGADFSHPDLKGNLVPGANFSGLKVTADATDDNLHGTHVAGTIAAMGRAVHGVCARARVIPVKIGTAQGRMTDSSIIAGIQFAASRGARVINASFGGPGYSEAIKSAIQKASGTLIVAAAGNGAPKKVGTAAKMVGYSIDLAPLYPAAYALPNLIAVAATDNQDHLGVFSNYGVKTVQIAAPGVGILSTMPMQPTEEMRKNNLSVAYGALDGTSMATPHVTGAATMLLAKNPRMTPEIVKNKLIGTSDAVPGVAGKLAGGRLNLARLLQ